MASRITEENMKIRIDKAEETLRKNPDADLKDFSFQIASQVGCSLKTAREYIKIAKWRIDNEIK